MKKGLLFDLDGVLVDTAKYHFLAWKQLAEELGISFTEENNEKLKGVSRRQSLDIILGLGGLKMEETQKEDCCNRKNALYLKYINKITQEELLPGVEEFIEDAREKRYSIALGSASRNAGLILDKLNLSRLFDAVVDGNKVLNAKPDPEVFVTGADLLGIDCRDCIVFEDSTAGIQAAHAGGMKAVGIGSVNNLPEADICLASLLYNRIDDIVKRLI